MRPLTSKRAAEVAYQLLDIFLLLGAPEILQSDNGSEFTAGVITELKLLWPDLVMVHGKPRHPQSQGSVERANCDIKDMLVAWLSDNNTTDWTVGLKFVQFQKNSSFHSGIQRSPFTALFGSDAKVGLTTSALPHDVIHRLQSEDDVTTDKIISLRSAVQQESRSGGQGFAKCNCAGSKRCQTNRCKCFKLKVKCNSRCHSSLHCENKASL